MSIGKISQILHIADNMDTNLQKKVKKFQGHEKKEDYLPYKDAIHISKIQNKNDQKLIAKKLKEVQGNQEVRTKLIADFKNAPDDIKEKVRQGNIELEEIKRKTLESTIKKQPELYTQTAMEWQNELTAILTKAGKKFKEEQDKIELLNPAQAKYVEMFIQSIINEYLIPFMNKLKNQQKLVEVIEHDKN